MHCCFSNVWFAWQWCGSIHNIVWLILLNRISVSNFLNYSTSYSTYSTVIIGYEMASETQTINPAFIGQNMQNVLGCVCWMNVLGNHKKCEQQLIPRHIKSFRARALHNIPLIRAAGKDNIYVQWLTNLVIEKNISRAPVTIQYIISLLEWPVHRYYLIVLHHTLLIQQSLSGMRWHQRRKRSTQHSSGRICKTYSVVFVEWMFWVIIENASNNWFHYT